MDIQDVLTLKNVAEFKNENLLPDTKYFVRVLALYEDEFESESEESSFKTGGNDNIKASNKVSFNVCMKVKSSLTIILF